MLETFGMHNGGKEYRRLVYAFERIFGATMFFGTDSMRSKAKVVQRSRFNFLREAQIWYDRQPDQRVLGEDFENVLRECDCAQRRVPPGSQRASDPDRPGSRESTGGSSRRALFIHVAHFLLAPEFPARTAGPAGNAQPPMPPRSGGFVAPGSANPGLRDSSTSDETSVRRILGRTR